MGTNISDFMSECHRVLKLGGLVRIVEVRSRFESTRQPSQDCDGDGGGEGGGRKQGGGAGSEQGEGGGGRQEEAEAAAAAGEGQHNTLRTIPDE